jgi:tripartite-type tricarboxylate transporter receptor subunit TctC
MKLPRRNFLHLAAGARTLPAFLRIARADTYPTRPVHIIVGFPAGTSSDITARLISQWLSERLGQQFVVENRTGAGTNVAADTVVHASPDGYSLLWITQTNAISDALQQSEFRFQPRHSARGQHHARASSDDGKSVSAGQERSRVYCFC